MSDPSAEAAERLREAAGTGKCRACGCLHMTLDAVERAAPCAELEAAVRAARERLQPARYDCLGCEPCFPAIAANALGLEVGACPAEAAARRDGWPPLPGAYTVLRAGAPVAVCTLTDGALGAAIARQGWPEVAIVGTLHTENLGIERLILNVLANPCIRFLLVCGEDSRGAVGHLPGQSLGALARSGVDDEGRIVGARGRRPVLRNVPRGAVDHFRRTVEVVDRAGPPDVDALRAAARECAARDPGPAEPFAAGRDVAPQPGYIPERLVPDPAGYFVVFVDRARQRLVLEHYSQAGALDGVVEARAAAEAVAPAIDRGWVTRLDHAAYLGRELARAERALATGEAYVQDGAPERACCGKGRAC